MPPKNPLTASLGKLKDVAAETLADPKGAATKAVGQAVATASLGRHVAGGVVSGVTGRVLRRGGATSSGSGAGETPSTATAAAAPSQQRARRVPEASRRQGDPLAGDARAAAAQQAPAATEAEPETIVAPTEEDRAAAHDASPADLAPAPAKKAPAKKAPAKKAPAKKAPAKKAPAKKAPAKKAPAKKAAGTDAPDAPDAPDADSLLEPTPEDRAAAHEASPVAVAQVAAKKAPAEKAATKKAPAERAATKKAPAKKAATKKAADPAAVDGPDAADGPGDKLPTRARQQGTDRPGDGDPAPNNLGTA